MIRLFRTRVAHSIDHSAEHSLTFAGRAVFVLMSAVLTVPSVYANGGVDREKKEITIEARPSADEALKRFTTNVSELAKSGSLAPFVGERQQIRRILEVMSKSGTKVVYVLGEAGSGKSVLVEYVGGQLQNAELFRLDLNALQAGTGYRGMLEDRLEALLEAFKNRSDRVLFIDEAHMAMRMPDFMDTLKPAMARGELSLVFATTESEFREFIEKDPALTSRASVYRLESPNEAKVLNILRANQQALQTKHGIAILDSALQMTARLTMRYYSNEPVARKALDLIDRAAAREVLNQRLGSYDSLALEDRKESLQLNQKALVSDLQVFPGDEARKAQLQQIRAELQVIESKIKNEASGLEIPRLEKELADVEAKMRQATMKGDFLEAAKISNEQIPALKQQLQKAKGNSPSSMGAGAANMLTEATIARFVSQEIGIPDSILAETNQAKLERMFKSMSSSVLGQPEAINAIVQKTKIRMEAVEPIAGPQGVIVMDGLPGTGKGEMMKAIALSIFGDAKRLIRVNMNSVGGDASAYLFGHEAGIKDSEKGGALDGIRRTPYTVVGFDEFDKASKTGWTSLLQILGEGLTQDARGRTMDFRNSIVVMMSNFTGDYAAFKNIWSQAEIETKFQMEPGSLTGLTSAEKDARVLDAAMAMKGVPAEVRDRIGVKLVFNALDLPMAVSIAQKILNEQVQFIWEEKNVRVNFEAAVAEALAKASFNPVLGARPVIEARSVMISNMLADLRLEKGMTVDVSFQANSQGTGGLLKSKVNGVERLTRELTFRPSFEPRAVKAQAIGEAGKPIDPTDSRAIIERAARKTPRR